MVTSEQAGEPTIEIQVWDGADLLAVAEEARERRDAQAARVEAARLAKATAEAEQREAQGRGYLERLVLDRLGVTACAATRDISGARRPVVDADGIGLTAGGGAYIYAVRPCPGCGAPTVDDRTWCYDLASLADILARPMPAACEYCPGLPVSAEGDPIDEAKARELGADLRCYAGAAWAEMDARESRNLAASLAADAERRAGVLARVLRRDLGVIAEPTSGAIDLDGVTLVLEEDGYAAGALYAALRCPGCGETVNNRVTSLASLGRQLAEPLKCRDCRTKAQATFETTEERLVAALLAFVEETVDGRR